MRSLSRQKQNVWFSHREKKQVGINTNYVYSPPVKKRMTVSSTAGTPEEIKAGIIPDYDRYITVFDRNIDFKEGDAVFVDVIPKMDTQGNLEVTEGDLGIEELVTEPDYIIKRILGTQKGVVKRYGIKKRGNGE